MTLTTTACPHCGSINEYEAVTTIRPNSEEMRDLLHGELNKVVCCDCESVYPLASPIVYRDDEKKRLIYLLPEQMCPDINEALDRMGILQAEAFVDLDKDRRPVCRLVLQMSHLIEKISLLERGHDDRLIEYVKYTLYNNAPDLDIEKHELLFDFTATGQDSLTFIALDRETHQGEYSLEFNQDDYLELRSFFSTPQGTASLNQLFPTSIVCVDLLAEQEKQEAEDE